MTDLSERIFLFKKDLSNKLKDRFFIESDTGGIRETNATEIAQSKDLLITHDFWLIAKAIYDITGTLPTHVIDIREFTRAIAGFSPKFNPIDKESITDALTNRAEDKEILQRYGRAFFSQLNFSEAIYLEVLSIVRSKWHQLKASATLSGELERYMGIEKIVFNCLWMAACKGVKVDHTILSNTKREISDDFYRAIKRFGCKFDLPFEVPCEDAIINYVEQKGFNLNEASIDYILNYLPMTDDFGSEVLSLLKLDRTHRALNDISCKSNRVHCLVDSFGSITSRITLRNPAVQSMSGKYRNIFVADTGKELGYIDYSQYEVGIMAALSLDPLMRNYYDSGDLYSRVSEEIFENIGRRKDAKKLFLSFAYGMSVKNIGDAARELGAERRRVVTFFRQFEVFEAWKKSTIEDFIATGSVRTSVGNHLKAQQIGFVTNKEKRSCISQLVQGTASLIFKKALIKLCEERCVDLLIPMHDAVFVQYPIGYDIGKIQAIFEEVFTSHFGRTIGVRTTVGSFAPEIH